MPSPPQKIPYTPSSASFPRLDPSLALAEKLMPSFVAIDFYLPYLVDGMKATQFYGTGFIVSTNPPLIVCDRDTIPIGLGDIFITFANSIIIPGISILWSIAKCAFIRDGGRCCSGTRSGCCTSLFQTHSNGDAGVSLWIRNWIGGNICRKYRNVCNY